MMRWKSNQQEAFTDRYTREAKDTERKIVEYYRKHASEVPDGSFVMNFAEGDCMKLSQKLQREHSYVERVLGDKVICRECGVKLADYPLLCEWGIQKGNEGCFAFQAIEAAKKQFAQEEAEAGR